MYHTHLLNTLWRAAVLALAGAILLSSCSVITDKDRDLVERTLHDATGCVYIQGSGGAGASAIPVGPGAVPLGAGYGQGSITAARSNRDDAKVSCGPDGAKVE
jgi:hypothetical protein